jgi:hypothetical protein
MNKRTAAVSRDRAPNDAPRECAAVRADLLETFKLRANVRGYLWAIGEYHLQEAADVLQFDAERDGLVKELGQNAVQTILAYVFQYYFEHYFEAADA